MPMPVAAIILAAGASRRLGQPKQLLTLDNETLLARVLRLSREAGASPLVAVLGAHCETIAAAIQDCGAHLVFNEQWELGLASSIHAGLRALDAAAPGAHGVLLLGCDQPRLTSAHLGAMIESFTGQGARAIVASKYAGVLGVPAIFPRSIFPDLLALRGDQGARALLAQPQCPPIPIEFPGGEIDIDSPSDLAALEQPRSVANGKRFLCHTVTCLPCTAGTREIAMNDQTNTEFLRRAIALATENVVSGAGGPFAALIVRDGCIVGEGVNTVTASNDPTAHGEVNAIRSACSVLGTFSLAGCQLYTSCEPCPMCLAAAHWARVDAVFYGASAADAARAGFDDAFLYEEFLKDKSERTLPVMQLLGDEAWTSFAAWLASANKVEY
jgi:CTP:molybdopterin cytidylyltransferase MocA/tRNA(Arg) A34 adenosine deaminase TadA